MPERSESADKSSLMPARTRRPEIAVGDVLLANFTVEMPGSPSRCTDIWIGAETHKLVSEAQAKKRKAAKK